MESYIYTSLRTYIVDVLECDDGLYKLKIHDNNGTYHYPKYFIYCDVDGITAVKEHDDN